MGNQHQAIDWRKELQNWLDAGNSRIMPAESSKLLQEFNQRFPKEKLSELTLDTYSLGTPDSSNSFCYWLEFKTDEMGSVAGGNASKWGVYWARDAQAWKWNKALNSTTPEEALQKLKTGLIKLVEATMQEEFGRIA